MKRRLFICVLALALVLTLAGCGCKHEWMKPDCTTPKTCHLCGETEGEALGHTWEDADCLTAKTCSVCGETEGAALGHSWQEADCQNPKTCTVCDVTEGEALEHDWQEATTEEPKTCSLCKLTEGERLITDSRFTTASTKELYGVWSGEVLMSKEMLGLETGFENGFACLVIVEFGKTGELTITMDVADPEAFEKDFKAATIAVFYESMEEQGMSKAQVDELVKKEYGMTVEEYVDEQLKNFNFSGMFAMYKIEGCYYVEGNRLYTAESWDDYFDGSKFSLENGILTIADLALPGTDEPVEFTRVE